MSKSSYFLILLAASFVLGCIAVWARFGSYFISYALYGQTISLENAGAWGDSFAVLNTLFSGAAIVGLVITVLMQKRSMLDQRTQFHSQLREQRNQFLKQYTTQKRQTEEQSKQFKTQNEYFLKNKFDVTFFEFLKFKTELRSELEYKPYNQKSNPYNKFRGVHSFNKASHDIDMYLDELASQNLDHEKNLINELMLEIFYKKNEVMYSIYFRTLYRFFKLIHDAEYLSHNEKVDYANIIRAQLSGTEVLIIGMNGLNPNSGNLHLYITEYRLLKYANDGLIRNVLSKHYPPEAFEARGD